MAGPFAPEPYLGEIRLFAGLFAPKDWAFCDGRLLFNNEYPELYQLIGNTYGGDLTRFALPDLQSRLPLHISPDYGLGKKGGSETVKLSVDELPAHSHTVNSNFEGGNDSPDNNVWGYSASNPYADAPGTLAMNVNAITTAGNNGEHENRIPFLAISYIISLAGVVPKP
jgi:microcystin-dependent protein